MALVLRLAIAEVASCAIGHSEPQVRPRSHCPPPFVFQISIRRGLGGGVMKSERENEV